jgi:hypothetical protein
MFEPPRYKQRQVHHRDTEDTEKDGVGYDLGMSQLRIKQEALDEVARILE